jgi:hypothetical protein
VRRFVPFVIPVFYVALSAALVRQLDRKNEQLARAPETLERLDQIATSGPKGPTSIRTP